MRLHLLYPTEDPKKSEGLRTILDIKPDILRTLPWELIYEQPNTWFFDGGNPFSRGTLDPKLDPRSLTWPIRVLVVVGSEANDKDVRADLEIEQMQRAFIKSPVPVDWYVCLRPTKAELKERIEKCKPQIFHFIGHGREANGYSYLELTERTKAEEKNSEPTEEEEAVGVQEWTMDDVSIDLKSWQPRLAFINACRSSSGGQENLWDIARTFAAERVPAVIGMQADIQGAAAAALSGKFYESLFAGQPVDRALAVARSAVRNLRGFKLRNRDWALATLYLQQLPDQILNVTPQIDSQTHAKYKADGRLKNVQDFVGRFKQRRELWHGVDEVEDYEDQFKHACIVVGNKEMGKTSLLQASMKVCALRGRRICYVDIGYDKTKEFTAILDIIRKGEENLSEVLCKPLPVEPFADFDKKYSQLLAKPDAVQILAGDENLCSQVFDSYQNALISIAATAPLILVLDHLNVIWETFNPVLVERLLLPIAQGELPNCRLLLACSADDYQKLSEKLKNTAHVVQVAKWQAERYEPLMRQICIYNDIDLDDRVEGVIKALSKLVNTDWEPIELRDLIKQLKRRAGGV
jgi:hypothetical protein